MTRAIAAVVGGIVGAFLGGAAGSVWGARQRTSSALQSCGGSWAWPHEQISPVSRTAPTLLGSAVEPEVGLAPRAFDTSDRALVEHLSQFVSEAEGHGDEGQRGVGCSVGWEYRGSGDEEVVDRMDPAVGIHHSSPWIRVHPGGAEVVIVALERVVLSGRAVQSTYPRPRERRTASTTRADASMDR